MREHILEQGLTVVEYDEDQVIISMNSVSYMVNCKKSLQKIMLRDFRSCLFDELLRDGDMEDIEPILRRAPSFVTMVFPNDNKLGENVGKWLGSLNIGAESFGLVRGNIGLLELNDIDGACNDVFGTEKSCFLMCSTESDSDAEVAVSIWG